MNSRVLFPGQARGPWLRLDAPLGFWGGVDPATGIIINTRHPQHGVRITDTILALPGTIGSSSSSAVLLELIRGGNAPAGIVMATVDAILIIGCIVGDSLGYASPPVIECEALNWPSGANAMIDAAGRLRAVD